jgi:hypothetical protein
MSARDDSRFSLRQVITVVVTKPTNEVIDVMTEPITALEFTFPEGAVVPLPEEPPDCAVATTPGVPTGGIWVGSVAEGASPPTRLKKAKASVDTTKSTRNKLLRVCGFMVLPVFHKIEVTDFS